MLLVWPCIEGYRESMPKKTLFAIHFTIKMFNQLYITNKTECFSFKSGYDKR